MSVSQPRYPVASVDEAYNACHPDIPLEPGDSRYVDLTPVRGGFNLARTVTQRIRRTPPPFFHKQLITGHRGCGKSTELKQLQTCLQERGFFAVYLDVEQALDLGDIEYLDILLSIARAVYEDLLQEDIQPPKRLLESLDRWFAETILTEEQCRDIEGTLRTEFGVEPRLPLLLRFLVTTTGLIKAGGSRRVEIRRVLERELRVFLQRLNELLDDVQARLARKGSKGLVVIVDGLEKMHYRGLPDGETTHSALFARHAELLKAPHCHIIYTVPVSLVFNVNLGDAFTETDFIPMVKITERDGHTPSEEGRRALFEVIARRVDVRRVFESEAVVHRLIEASGGSARDLMRLVRFACDEADERIIWSHAESAVRRLIREYDFLLREEHLERLSQVARQKRVPGDETSAWLLHHRLVLEYQNDERWADLHPAIRDNRRIQERLKE